MSIASSPQKPADGYVFDNAWQHAHERLSLNQAIFDPGTIRNLERLGVGPGWTCLEVGAGAGSIAQWLCERVGSGGRVVATDIDTRLLGPVQMSNLQIRQLDIAVAPPETEAFDLVHARLLLEHVPERKAALDHMLAAIKPGGWLLIEEFDHVNWLPGRRSDLQVQEVWAKFLDAYQKTMEARGADLEIGRFLCEMLDNRGLISVAAEGRAVLARGGSVGGQLFHLNFSQARAALVATGAINDDEMAALLSLFQDQSFTFVLPLLIAVWGLRPAR
jgi:SAM-dependent methyltransferase